MIPISSNISLLLSIRIIILIIIIIIIIILIKSTTWNFKLFVQYRLKLIDLNIIVQLMTNIDINKHERIIVLTQTCNVASVETF